MNKVFSLVTKYMIADRSAVPEFSQVHESQQQEASFIYDACMGEPALGFSPWTFKWFTVSHLLTNFALSREAQGHRFELSTTDEELEVFRVF